MMSSRPTLAAGRAVVVVLRTGNKRRRTDRQHCQHDFRFHIFIFHCGCLFHRIFALTLRQRTLSEGEAEKIFKIVFCAGGKRFISA
jgi:hypothetical protein